MREEIEQTLNDEREHWEKYGEALNEPGRCQGWIEALEYVLHQIDALDGGAQDLLSAQEYGARWLETHEDE